MDLAIKVEFLLMDAISSMFWSSMIELLSFTVLVFIFISDNKEASELAIIWLFIGHVIRGVLGLLIMRGIPKTHEIIANSCIPHEERLSMDKTFEYLTTSAKEALNHFTATTRSMLQAYFGFTLVCMIVDILAFLYSVKMFAESKNPYADCTLLISSLVFLALDLYYFAWINSLQKRVPPYISAGMSSAAFGVLDFFYKKIGSKIES